MAAFALFATWLDPAGPARLAWAAYSLLSWYLFYAIVLALAAWYADINWARPAVVIHAFDLLVFAVFMFLTTVPASPFFVFFVFSLICATLRWQWRGAMYTAAIAISVVIVMAVYPADLLREPEFEMNRFIIRIGYLAVVAALLGYLGAYEQQLRGELSSLAASRVLAAWEEREEPYLPIRACLSWTEIWPPA